MKRMVVFMAVLMFTAGAAYAKGYEVQKKAGEYDVTVTFDKGTPVASDNEVVIVVKDATGKAVTDAQVKAESSMPGMPGMPPMNYKVDAVLQGDVYKATLSLPMSGSWNLAVKITKAGKTATMKFTVDAK
jgi:hypothetical protein